MLIFGLKAKFLGLGIVRSEFVALNALAFEGKETEEELPWREGKEERKREKSRGMGNGRVGEGGQESGGSVQTHDYHN